MIFQPIAGRVRGVTHKKSNTKCQDAYCIRQEDSLLLMAAADGHGSSACKYSHVGAEKAVSSFCDIIADIYGQCDGLDQFCALLSKHREDTIPAEICKEWARKVAKYHCRVHKDEQFDSVLYGSTLLGLAISTRFVFAIQLGDGDILSVQADGSTSRVIEHERILGTETQSLSSDSAWRDMLTGMRHFSSEAQMPVLFMISTDGMANSYASDADFLSCGKDFVDLISNHGLDVVRRYLRSWLMQISKQGAGDDIALVLAASDSLWQ